jgi:hypothetical protein
MSVGIQSSATNVCGLKFNRNYIFIAEFFRVVVSSAVRGRAIGQYPFQEDFTEYIKIISFKINFGLEQELWCHSWKKQKNKN